MNESCHERELQISKLLTNELPPENRLELEEHCAHCRDCRESMEELRSQDRMLSDFAASWEPATQRLETKVLRALHKNKGSKSSLSQSIFILWNQYRYAGLSVAVSVLAFITISIMLSQPTSLYAQVTKTLERAERLHIVGHTFQRGEWSIACEIWHQKGKGYAIHYNHHGRRETVIDDGVHQWKYREGDSSAVRTKNRDSHMMREIEEVLNLREFERILATASIGTQIIRDHECHVYEWRDQTYRAVVYIDADKRAHRFEDFSRQDKEEWIRQEIQDFYYDVDIDPSLFEPDFGPNVNIVNAENQLDLLMNLVKLDDAVFKKEEFGHIFAVHEIQRVEGGIVYLLCSLRPTDATIRECGPILPSDSTGYGDFHFVTASKQLDNGNWRSYQPWDFAEVNHQGLSVMWYVLIQKGEWPEEVNECYLDVYFHTRGKLQQTYEAKGIPSYQRFRTYGTLSLPANDISISDALAKIYEEVEAIAPGVRYNCIRLSYGLEPSEKTGPNGEKTSAVLASTPRQMTKSDFINEGSALIRRFRP
ncbi:MAG: hypothetical protein C4527_16250 [Candidatus Omnitrophota bacterium]|jgi:outer membrane lipoprotein-sorting protein|nr:MAG: hypothetical protein C4527_16250 [Candidatus Omnitrophota bacterium]